MPAQVLATKLYVPPPRPGAVARPRLLARLNDGLRHSLGFMRKISLISAPAGFGKTALAAQWVAAMGGLAPPIRVAWVSLDERDADPARFLTYFVAALQTIIPDFGARILVSTPTLQPPASEATLTALLNELAALPVDCVLVVDDYHLADSPQVDEIVAFLVEHLPQRLHLALTTREDPQLPLARLAARGQMVELRAADLRFTPTETAEFLNHTVGLGLSAEDVAALEARTEGWIAGLQLAALSLQGRSDSAGFIKAFAGTHHFMMDYLLEEVLQRQTVEVQAFLLGTAILDRLCGPLCEAVLGMPAGSGQALLAALERGNLFVIPLDDDRQWRRYHRLFADLLRQRLQQSTADVASYHLRASQWHRANGYLAEAYQHALAAGAFQLAAEVAEQAWPEMEDTFQTKAWLGWVKQLPEAVARARPTLCAQLGWSFSNAGEPEISEQHLQDAERALTAATEGAEFGALPGSIALARAYNAQTMGRVADTIAYAGLAQRLIPEDDVYRRAQAVIMLEFTHWASGDLEAARRALDDWMRAMRQIGNVVFVVATAFAVADIQLAQGRMRDARRTFEAYLREADQIGPEAQAITAHHHLGLALLHWEMDDVPRFAAHWQKAEELGQRTTLVDWPHRWRVAQARVKQGNGDYDGALELLDEAQRVYVKNPVPDLRPVDALKAHVYLRQGRLSAALAWSTQRALSADDELSYLREFEHLTFARVLVATGSSRQAAGLLERLRQAAEGRGRMGSVIEILVAQALAYRAHGETAAAFGALERSLDLAEPEGYVRLFVDEGDAMRSLILDARPWLEQRTARAGHKVVSYVNRLLAAFAPPVDARTETPHRASVMLEPLSPRELEVLALISQGLSNQDIADRLFLALSTVKGYTRTLFDKLQVQRRTEAVVRARELGLL